MFSIHGPVTAVVSDQMDCLTFTSRIIESLAWPLCTLVIALAFREQIRELLSRVVKGKIPGGEFEFSPTAQQQLAIATASTGSSDDSVQSDSSEEDEDEEFDSCSYPENEYDLDEAYELLDASPRYAVVAGWRVLNRAALDALVDYDESSGSDDYPSKIPPPARIARYLREQDILSPDQLALFDELRQIRNSSIHVDDFRIDQTKAKEYLILTELLIAKLTQRDR